MRRRYRADDYRRAVALVRRALPGRRHHHRHHRRLSRRNPCPSRGQPGPGRRNGLRRSAPIPLLPAPRHYRLPLGCAGWRRRKSAAGLRRWRQSALPASPPTAAGKLGQTRPVLWETARPAATPGAMLWSGLTDNYIRVAAETNAGVSLANRIVPARLHRLDGKNVRATLDPSSAPPPGAPAP